MLDGGLPGLQMCVPRATKSEIRDARLRLGRRNSHRGDATPIRSPTGYAYCILGTLLAYQSLTPPCSLRFCSPGQNLREAEHEREVFFQSGYSGKVFRIRSPSASRAPDARSGRGAKRRFLFLPLLLLRDEPDVYRAPGSEDG